MPQKCSQNEAQERPRACLSDLVSPPLESPRPPEDPPTAPQAHPKTPQRRICSVKFAPRASKSSRDVERKVENKHLNLKSETHAQNRQRGAARDERSEDLESEVRPKSPTKNRLHPKGNPKSSRTTSDTIVYHISKTVWHNLHTEHPWRGGGGVRPQGVLDNKTFLKKAFKTHISN